MSRIAIFFNARREQGGLYQYACTLLSCLLDHAVKHEYVVFNATLSESGFISNNPRITLVDLPRNGVKVHLSLELAWMQLARRGLRRGGWRPQDAQIRRYQPDAILYVKPGIHPFLWSYPAIFPIHDLQHRLQPHFPEVSEGGEYRRREYIYLNSIPVASAILTDSEVGKQDVINLYAAKPERVHPLPYLAAIPTSRITNESQIKQVVERYHLPDRYFFYPAAFWKHKNHDHIIEAIRLLRDEFGLGVHMVFAGGYKHEYARLAALVEMNQLSDRIHFIGYVPDEHLSVLYQLSDGLVMPTYFGPTNIPVLEAWHSGCPVVTSDIRGIREQVGPAGILVDPNDAHAIAQAMQALYTLEALRHDLAREGRKRVAEWTPVKFAERLEQIITLSIQDKSQA